MSKSADGPAVDGDGVSLGETFLLGDTGQRLSRIGMGGCPLGGHGWGPRDDKAAREAVAAAYDRGINLFDTADCYGFGQSERLIAEGLGDHKKDVVIATKFGVRWDEASGKSWKDTSPGYVRTALEGSLRRLGLDCIPLYFIHWTDGKTPIDIRFRGNSIYAEASDGDIYKRIAGTAWQIQN